MASDNGAAAPENPAGRVLAFLRTFQRTRAANDNAMLALMEIFGEEQEASRIYLQMTHLRIEAESVPKMMAPYEAMFGYRSYAQHFPQIIQATKQLQLAHGHQASGIINAINDAGWAALEYANEVLGHYRREAALTVVQASDYLSQVRRVTDAITNDDSLSPGDRSRIVDLLRKVEQALLDVKINGFLPVQEAAAAAGAIVHAPGLWERVVGKTWVEGFFTTVGGLVLTLQGADSAIAVSEYVKGILGGS